MFSLILAKGVGQECEYSKKMLKQAQKHFTNESIISATDYDPTFRDFNKVGSTHFVKSDSGYYMRLYLVRDFSRKMDLLEDNPMIFELQNDSLITLYPDKSMFDKSSGLITQRRMQMHKVYYEVSAKQLQFFSSIPIENVKLYVTLKKKSEEGENELEIIDFEVKKEKWQTNFMASANCILQ